MPASNAESASWPLLLLLCAVLYVLTTAVLSHNTTHSHAHYDTCDTCVTPLTSSPRLRLRDYTECMEVDGQFFYRSGFFHISCNEDWVS